MTLLQVKQLRKQFGGLVAVSDLDVNVNEGEIVGLIGPNGAGKTTFFNLITGFIKPSSGRVVFRGQDITSLGTSSVASKGLLRTFQANSLFYDKTVLENTILAHHLQAKVGVLNTLLNSGAYRRQEEEIRQKAIDTLNFMGLGALMNELASNLPHGHQRALGVAMAVSAGPKLLCLDEPITGMNPREITDFIALIGKLVSMKGITLILVEHDMKTVMSLCGHIVVLKFGRKLAEGTPEEIQNNPEVVDAYLGAEH